MPTSNTWTANGYPAAAFATPRTTASGRERVWNNTENFGAIPKDEKPVNGYSDVQFRTFQNERFKTLTPAAGGSSVYTEGPGATIWNGALGYAVAGRFDDRFGSWDAIIQDLVNDATVKALVKMADAKINVAVALKEASKTSDLILDTARRIDRAYRAFRKGDLRGIAQNLNITPKRLHKSWLEYKYGWMPLLMDVKGAAEFFAQQHVERKPRFTVSARESVVKTDNWNYTVATYGPGSPHRVDEFISGSIDVKVKIWCELSSPHFSEMQQIGLTNPALYIWETIPFSFVFDWFISVGDWLVAMTAQQGVTIRRKMVSVLDNTGWTLSEAGTSAGDASWVYTASPNSYGGSRRRYVRSIPDLSPFSLYPPRTQMFSPAKFITSLALIQGNYRGNQRTARL